MSSLGFILLSNSVIFFSKFGSSSLCFDIGQYVRESWDMGVLNGCGCTSQIANIVYL